MAKAVCIMYLRSTLVVLNFFKGKKNYESLLNRVIGDIAEKQKRNLVRHGARSDSYSQLQNIMNRDRALLYSV